MRELWLYTYYVGKTKAKLYQSEFVALKNPIGKSEVSTIPCLTGVEMTRGLVLSIDGLHKDQNWVEMDHGDCEMVRPRGDHSDTPSCTR
jgi:hypothetical protein